MAEMNTAQQLDVFVDVTTLNRFPLSDIFVAIGPARVLAENVTVGPVMTDEGERFLVRIEGRADVLKATEAVAIAASAPQVRRYIDRLEARRARSAAEAKRQTERAARIAACSEHEFVSQNIGRCLHYVECKHCGAGETVSSDG